MAVPSSDPNRLKSPQARYAARAAAAAGYAFRSLDGDDGYLFEVRDGVRKATFASGAGTPYALNDARAASIARDKAFCAIVLREAGVPVLPGEMFFVTPRWAEMRGPGRELEDALRHAAGATYPVFCKPISASNGLYAEVIDSADEFEHYVQRVSHEHFAILIQPFVRAPECRVFVLNGRPLFSYFKTLPTVWTDGEHSLRELVAAKPREAGAPALKPRGRDVQGRPVAADAVLAAKQQIILEGPANRAAGGSATQLADGAPRRIGEIAVRAAEAVGLSLAAVDMFDPIDGDPVVIEVNSNPMIATLEDQQRWYLIIEIWRANIEAALK